MKCRFYAFILFFLLEYAAPVYANDSLLVTQLLKRIEQLQVKENGVFPAGLFPSYRMYALNNTREIADPNIYFTGLIVYTLQSLMPNFTHEQQSIAQKMIEGSLPVFNKYKNQKGRPTYNFWTTDTLSLFPNSGLISLLTKSHALPDDFDDTSMILLALSVDSTTADSTHIIMQNFIKKDKKMANHFFEKYTDIKAYSTWFGKKFPVEYDISVLCNTLLFVQSYQLSWTPTDSASLALITQVVKEKKHLTEAQYMSHYYSKPSLILYHISRLMDQKEIPALTDLKPQMIQEAIALYKKSKSFLEKTILSTALLRWNTSLLELNLVYANSFQSLIEDDQKFIFFTGNFPYALSFLPDWMRKLAGRTNIGRFDFYSQAYNNLLVIENLVLQNRKQGSVSLQ